MQRFASKLSLHMLYMLFVDTDASMFVFVCITKCLRICEFVYALVKFYACA